jgi:hypothetical protein
VGLARAATEECCGRAKALPVVEFARKALILFYSTSSIPSGAKALVCIAEMDVRAKQAAEKGIELKEEPEKHPSGAKALVDFTAVMARLKSCPFKTAAQPEFFRSL